MGRNGRRERESRFTEQGGRCGSTATHSQHYLQLASELHRSSVADARGSQSGNISYYVFAGIPILSAALQAFVVEYEFIFMPGASRRPIDISSDAFIEAYGINGDLLEDQHDFIELRNEILPRPCSLRRGGQLASVSGKS